jgi:hypothetical protein
VIIPVAGLLALLSPLLAGGRLRGFARVQIRQGWVVGVALLAQIVVISVLPQENHVLLAVVHVATYAAAGWFVWVNRRIPGLWLIALGAASNGITIAVNGGTLPARAGAMASAGLAPKPGEFVNSGTLAHPHLAFLGDVFAIPAGWPLPNVFSIGDVLIVAGVFWGAHRICGSRLAPVWTPPATSASTPGHDTATGIAIVNHRQAAADILPGPSSERTSRSPSGPVVAAPVDQLVAGADPATATYTGGSDDRGRTRPGRHRRSGRRGPVLAGRARE